MTIGNVWRSVQLGEPQLFNNVAVVPIVAAQTSTLEYLTLGEALRAGLLRLEEISQSGSVPELKAISRADKPILLLDGEELIGAKQNRVLNTSILLKENSETIIPVSCTEHGRWAYSSATFSASDVIMAQKIRTAKQQSVSASLARRAKYSSDQGEVWQHIAMLHQKAKSSSPTGAMSEVFRARQVELGESLNVLTVAPRQKGMIVIVNGEVAGLDLLSSATAYEKLHPKLVRSYVLEGILEDAKVTLSPEVAKEKALSFLQTISDCEAHEFASPGYGQDRRFKSPSSAGSALFHNDELIHAAFFSLPPATRTVNPLEFRRRPDVVA
jgi:hypothetical protein